MAFRNPTLINTTHTVDSVQVDTFYKSVQYKQVFNLSHVVNTITTTPRYYKSFDKIKPYHRGPIYFSLPIFNVSCKELMLNSFTDYVVVCKLSVTCFGVTSLDISSSYSHKRYKEVSFTHSNEFMFLVSANLNKFLTSFAKYVRSNLDSTKDIEEYFREYYASTQFDSLIKNVKHTLLVNNY